MAAEPTSPRKLTPRGNHGTGPVPVDRADQDPAKPAAQNGDTVVMPAETAAAMEEEHEILHASIRAASVGQLIVATVAVIGLFYLAKIVLVTILTALLIAFMLEPIVNGLGRLKVPRPVGALVAVLLLLAVFGALTYFFYNRVIAFSNELPKYSEQVRGVISKITSKTRKIEENTSKLLQPAEKGKNAVPVQVQQAPGVFHLIAGGAGAVGNLLLSLGFIPFLVYFMLSWQEHARRATVQLFPKEHRITAHRTLGRISIMIRSFIIGNLVVGLVNSAVSGIVFWQLGISYWYFIGIISGFASVIPYLGIVLAVVPPLASGIGVLGRSGVLIVIAAVFILHLVSMNVLYPKLVGRRVQLNPLAVSLGLLFWAWIWGAMGLLLAVPIVAATKIICDHVDSLRPVGVWLGE
jgi:predicted PurR-regulated permease PerM